MTSTLYRSYLRVFEKWPVDTTKKGRDLGEYIRLCVAEAFKGSAEPRDTSKCEEIQASLNRITNNTHKEAFYVSNASSASGLTEIECKQLISNEFLTLMEEEDKGVQQSVKEKLFGKKAEVETNVKS